jgi:hypothetical protein
MKLDLLNFRDLVASIASHLGEGWRLDPKTTNGWGRINHDGGRGLDLYLSTYNHKIEITGTWPKTERGEAIHFGDNNIYVSSTRAGKAIAGDITRRFLPEYNAKFAMAQDKVQRVNQAVRNQASALGELIEEIHLGGMFSEGHQQPGEYNDHCLSVRVSFDEKPEEIRVRLKIADLTVDVARKLLAVWCAWQRFNQVTQEEDREEDNA